MDLIWNAAVSFYPNECFICKKKTTLKRCSRCQMISYCGENHQKSDWNSHKNFCKFISDLMKVKGVTHIYEAFRGCDSQAWMAVRAALIETTSYGLNRNIEKHELDMLRFPRCCIVCHDTRQDNLTNCPNCPLASFCKKHPWSASHDKMCSEYKYCHSLSDEYNKSGEILPMVIISTANSTPIKSSKLLTNIAEFLDQNLTMCPNSKTMKAYASTIFAIPLSFCSVIQKLNYTVSPKMSFHLSGFQVEPVMNKCWEILLHLFPDLSCLTVEITDFRISSYQEVMVCCQCSSMGKKLIVKTHAINFGDYLLKDSYKEPNMSAIVNLGELWPSEKILKKMSSLSCPLFFTAGTQRQLNSLAKHFSSPFWKSLIYYEGKNEFGSLCSVIHWKEWEIAKPNHFILMIKAPKQPSVRKNNFNESQSIPGEIKENGKQPEKILKKYFYPGVCHVCRASGSSQAVSCKRCKMIFYCGESHMKKDSSEHREICKVILKFLSQKGTPHLYDNLQSSSEESWLNAKLGFIKEAKLKLKRDLLDFEEQMFLFPKICFTCRESDLSVLKTCKCGVSLCKIHRDDPMHKNLCNSFSLELKLGINKDIPTVFTVAAVPLNKSKKGLPPSLENFMDSYITLKNSNPSTHSIIKILVSAFITRPLTFIYAFEKLKMCVPKKMVIHIFGAIDTEIQDEGYWRIVTYWLNNLQSLTVVFIGIEFPDKQKAIFRHPLTFINSAAENGNNFELRTIRGRYDQYFRSNAFSKPDMIIGYNLDLHKSNSRTTKCNWTETLSVIKTINVPLLLTARSEERARKDTEFVRSVLGKVAKYEFCQENPYSSLVPERDFKTEKLCYSNKYIIVYKKFAETKTIKKSDSNTIKKLDSNAVKSDFGANDKSMKSAEDESLKLRIKNQESKVQTPKNINQKEKINLNNDELLKNNFLLQQENKVLKENLYIQEENERLRNEIKKLENEFNMLKTKV